MIYSTVARWHTEKPETKQNPIPDVDFEGNFERTFPRNRHATFVRPREPTIILFYGWHGDYALTPSFRQEGYNISSRTGYVAFPYLDSKAFRDTLHNKTELK